MMSVTAMVMGAEFAIIIMIITIIIDSCRSSKGTSTDISRIVIIIVNIMIVIVIMTIIITLISIVVVVVKNSDLDKSSLLKTQAVARGCRNSFSQIVTFVF